MRCDECTVFIYVYLFPTLLPAVQVKKFVPPHLGHTCSVCAPEPVCVCEFNKTGLRLCAPDTVVYCSLSFLKVLVAATNMI